MGNETGKMPVLPLMIKSKLARCQFHRVGNHTGKMPVPQGGKSHWQDASSTKMPVPATAQTATIKFTLSGVAEWE
ncbi:hypothetical protein LYNGBM3L_67910 [Moorena producens 3L]|uniref:Uncharacterized protein n=1 Tax=Moorena producens 3L TaxID=489825 RepID=F4Y1F2_9CYAN|nr:hypothetical protein LYNGBM3L_67910 [Moorena producens 3L]